MRERLFNLRTQALSQILDAKSESDLEELRIKLLGKKGEVNEITKNISKLDPSVRSEVGRLINEVKQSIVEAFDNSPHHKSQISSLNSQTDPTLPGFLPPLGHLHPVTHAIAEISSTFEKIGFIRVRYPEVDWDWYAFESLNMPKTHPARDEWETFFIDSPEHPTLGKMILTPQTSNGQVREMERLGAKPPIRMIDIAKCYRRQSDASHTPMFHQFEGLVIDKGINITHLKGTIDYFVQQFFGKDRKSRLRPYHFQFTEPSFEVDETGGGR